MSTNDGCCLAGMVILDMEYRAIGGSTVVTASLCFGGNVFGWTTDERQSFLLLDALRDTGLNFLDTADLYSRWASGNSGGESEIIIGRWLRSRGGRDRIVIATKVGADMGEGRAGLSARYIKQAVEASLMRLGTDYIDLYQSHFDDLGVPLEETLGAFDDLVQAGKVRAIGASNYTAQRFAEALDCSERHGLVRYSAFQPHYNLVERSHYEGDAADLCARRGIGALPFASLANGFLTGKYRQLSDLADRPRGSSIAPYLNERGMAILAALDEIGAQYRAGPAAIAIAWLMTKPAIHSPIVSATSVSQIADLVKATELALDAEAVHLLDRASG
ncbi:aryl-alcohol dehydrogenase-like predicted oxidoreductase [Sphingopyxis panaciterrae]|uniref:aldo/keto reductase n=1 Tax=Sphingopyxis panaciterrae TaxID=363841 RepID=UPI001FB9D240|nr:aldo/keto reductase [Sphingopyxis panaciterrae]NIJ37413.1 aryl-alcohol dehydrogenase-like predicted oxidoreductase [Sphingopyxis panaciterrae]